MNDERYKNYLEDLGKLTTEYAREAIQDYISSKGTDAENFNTGYMMGYHRFITLMQQQAEAFNIPLTEIGLSDIDESEFFK